MGKQRHELRRDMRAIMANLDERWLRAASSELCNYLNQLIESELKIPVSTVLAWTKFFAGEADLSGIISKQLDQRSVYLPQMLPDKNMSFVSIGRDWGEEVAAGMYGIPEPGSSSGDLYNSELASETVVIVPGLAFDRQGNRIGRGKAYYDRFLGTPQMSKAIKIGVCWSLQLVDRIPTEPHDVAMNWVCHERGFYQLP